MRKRATKLRAAGSMLLLFLIVGTLILPMAHAQRGALQFNRLGYATSVDDADLDLTAKAITVEAWIKHDGKSDENAVIVSKYDDGTNYANYELGLDGAGEEVSVRFTVGYVAYHSAISSVGIPANQWTHVAGVYNGTKLFVYINSQLVGEKDYSSAPYNSGRPLGIGAQANGTRYFSGQIDEVRIWKVIRTSIEIRNNMYQSLAGNETGLVAYYPFTGAGAARYNDATTTGTNNVLTVTGTAPVVSPGVYPVPPDLVASSGAGKVVLKWAERLGPSDANKASGFKIYRATMADLSDRQLINSPVSGATTYTNTGLTNGSVYYYQIASVDAASNESDGSGGVIGTPYTVQGGGALKLDGTTFASVTDRPSLNLKPKTITVEAWIKHDGKSAGDAIIVSKRKGALINYELSLVGSGEEVPVRFTTYYEGYNLTSTVGIPANQWAHVAGVYDGAKLRIYVNGQVAGEKNFTYDPYVNTGPLRFGAAPDNTKYFSGLIDEVRIWNKVRTEAEIRAEMDHTLAGNEEGLVAYYRFDEVGKAVAMSSGVTPSLATLETGASIVGTGCIPMGVQLFAVPTTKGAKLLWQARSTTPIENYRLYRATKADGSDRALIKGDIDDAETSYNDETTTVGTVYFYELMGVNSDGQQTDYSNRVPITAEINQFGNALSLNGTGYVHLTDRPSLDIDDKAITVEAWIKHTGASAADAAIVSKRDGNAVNYELSLAGSGTEVPVRFNVYYEGYGLQSTGKVKADEWTHVAGTYDDANLKLYLNGVPSGTTAWTQDPSVNNKDLGIGANIDKITGYFRGAIDEVRIWHRALPADEIAQNYNKVLTGNEYRLVAYFRMDEKPGAVQAWASDLYPKGGILEGDANFVARAAPVDAEDDEELPAELTLAANYPNPFRTQTTIRFGLPQATRVRLVIYDAIGRQIDVLVDAEKPAGFHNVTFRPGNLPSGMYFYQLQVGGKVTTGRMLLFR